MNRAIWVKNERVKVKPQWGEHASQKLRFGIVTSDGPLKGYDFYDVELTTGETIEKIAGKWLDEPSESELRENFRN